MNICTYILNLPQRVDRKEECLLQIDSSGLNKKFLHFIDAKYTPRNGAIGCSLSHAYALSQFLFDTEAPFCLILEDDFVIKNPETFCDDIKPVVLKKGFWDVLLLATNGAVGFKTDMPNVYKVINSQTCPAYMVTREYAPTLIKVFYESANFLSQDFFQLENNVAKHFYALDMLWKHNQQYDKFMAFMPQLIHQRKSYSDIENEVKDYKV
jgi:GR25 family glycosyltransferase involved in LPS biosynthesis